MRRLSDAFAQAFKGMFRNGLITFVSIFVLISCLLFVGSFALIALNIGYNLEDVSDLNEIEVFLEFDADDETVARVEREILRLDNVASAIYVSKEDGLSDMTGEFADYGYLFEDISDEENPLSDKFRVLYIDNDKVTTLDYELKQIEGVRKVNSRLDIAATVDSLQNGISVIFVWFTVLCTVVCMFVIINTIKISVYSRRDEITIMRYIGASRTYIAAPFVLEGAMIGVVGAGAAYFLEKLIYSLLTGFVTEQMNIVKLYTYAEMTPTVLTVFFAISLFTGIVGSLISLGKYVEA
ncbi:MAG: ABC transporter permease [Clostridia bacterium]|nr:ABC transporter permease [Clostridia bacterium]